MLKNIFKSFSVAKKIHGKNISDNASKVRNNLFPIPSFYYIDVCNICNLKCPFCQTGKKVRGFTQKVMSKENYQTILEKISLYAKQIHLYNWGEPFLNKDIIEIISMTAKKNIFSIIHSNLSMREFTVDESDAIVSSGLSFLNVAIDGASQDSYEKYRKGGNFDLVIKNIKQINESKYKLKSNLPYIRWRFLINAFNEHELNVARNMAKDLGLIFEYCLMNIEEESWRSSLHDRMYSEEWPKVEYEGIIPDEIYSGPTNLVHLHPAIPEWCNQLFTWMNICPNGDLIPCSAVHGDRYVLGNLLESKIEDIWYGDNFQKCRDFLLNYGPQQCTQSVCERQHCHLTRKYIDGFNGLAQAGLNIEFVQGVWEEPMVNWLWLSNEAEMRLTSSCDGEIHFDLIIPDNDIHSKVLPLDLHILLDGKLFVSNVFEHPGKKEFSLNILAKKNLTIKFMSDKFVIPDQLLSNSDNRKLSLIVKNFILI